MCIVQVEVNRDANTGLINCVGRLSVVLDRGKVDQQEIATANAIHTAIGQTLAKMKKGGEQ